MMGAANSPMLGSGATNSERRRAIAAAFDQEGPRRDGTGTARVRRDASRHVAPKAAAVTWSGALNALHAAVEPPEACTDDRSVANARSKASASPIARTPSTISALRWRRCRFIRLRTIRGSHACRRVTSTITSRNNASAARWSSKAAKLNAVATAYSSVGTQPYRHGLAGS